MDEFLPVDVCSRIEVPGGDDAAFRMHKSRLPTARTVELIERTAPLVAKLIKVSRLPALRPLARQVADLVAMLRG